MLYSVDDLHSRENLMSALVLTVIRMDITEFHFRINAHWSILQNIIDKTLDIALSSLVILETLD